MNLPWTLKDEIYECTQCQLRWNGPPAPQPPCKKCGSLYMKWVTWPTWRQRHRDRLNKKAS